MFLPIHGLQFATIEMQFESIYDVKEWMFVNQLGRRNLTELQKTNLIGQRYNNQKQRHGGQLPKGSYQNDNSLKTAEKIADEYNIGEATVIRAADFATGLDHTTPKLQQDILQGKVKVNKSDALLNQLFENCGYYKQNCGYSKQPFKHLPKQYT